jgi:Asp-tRNA(Asn)/Glu-tRNA(Gln) amidotransferase A subunit family amidase
VTLAALAAAVRERRVPAEELVRRSLDRIERLDPALNAVVLVRQEAVDEARALDAGEPSGPLAGLPLLVKDNEDCAGLPTTFASLLHADAPPATEDCEAVERLRAAGAIVVGKTNLPEFAFEGFTANRLFGTTRNPWASDRSPGGSSGGSAVALITGMAPLATGTDGGGSIRIPAAFCGLVGLKTTNGMIGRRPPPSWIDLSTKGPLATSVADARLLLEVLRGPVAGDPTALPWWSPREGALPSRLLATPRVVAYDEPVSDGVAAAFQRAVPELADVLGLPVTWIDPPYRPEIDDDWFTLIAIDELTWIGRALVAERADDLTSHVRTALRIAGDISVDDYVAARRRRFAYTRIMDELLGDDAILVCPTMCVEGFPADGVLPGEDEPGTDSLHYNNQPANITGHPSLSVPAGTHADGTPFGLQVTGPRFADDLVLAVGEAWEAAYPWPLAAPGYEPFDP